ncbi:ankyrin repeat and SOCS box protein 11-like [Salarias fasciatus]|uniref:ankyrin repeat and SOCS box protein 11-like n=1 Tax=Salarias fasciatus TaxID=181472 RepID=UPI0011764E63|nr:ankyrin repeat and SOCS box protein 11-like [Salarias fasciatus]
MAVVECIRQWFRSLVIHQLTIANPLMADNWMDRSALHVAAFEGRLVLLHNLLAYGADVDTVTLDNVSALHEACLSGHYECAKLLLENGADPDRVTLDGGTPLFYACSSGNAACVQLILERGSSPHADRHLASPIHEAAKKNHQECLQLLLSWGAQVDLELPLVGTPLYCACMSQAADCAEVLLQAGADVRLGCGQDSPLHAAVRGGAAQIVALLLDFGADECCRNEDGQTPLDLSAENSAVRSALQRREICSLSQLCRVSVRRSVGANHLPQISSLLLPRRLQDYLLYQ